MSKINIGLFGFGVVGEGLCQVLQKAVSADVEIKKICIKDKRKKRILPEGYFTDSADEVFADKSINLIVELIDNAEDAYEIVKRALENRIPVVTGNKKMLAYHLEELMLLQSRYKTALLYDASACGSIPVIRNLEEYYDNDLLTSVKGILNGSSNYILSKVFNENMAYTDALKKAQELGFAESNPVFDVEGYDSLFKLVIITVHAFGVYVNPDRLFNCGISNLSSIDIRFAKERGYKIKLVAQVKKLDDERLTLYVLPQFVTKDKYIYSVEDEFNGVVIKGECYDKQFMFGKGAGGNPTGSSVLSDITARLHDYKYEYKKRNQFRRMHYSDDHTLRVYVRYRQESDISTLPLKNITEKYWTAENSYVVGEIRLGELIAAKETIRDKQLFVAAF